MSRTDLPLVIKPHTGSTYTFVAGDWGAVHTNRGGGAITYTLPSPVTTPAGVWVDIFVVAAGDNIVGTAAGEQMVLLNNATADSLLIGTDNEEIGNGVHIVNDGTSWLVFLNLAAEAATTTVTDA